jgi:DNA repair exonuclease SbcCD ATPase subunit
LNARWKLVKLEFSNLFSYGEDNVINFKDYKGILGIIAPNHMGKSAIIDIILFTLYDKFPRKGNVKDIVNNRKNNFKSKIIFKIGSWRYVVFKQGNKTDKGRVSSKIEFYRINRENIKEILTEETVVKTKNAILKYVGLYEDIIQTNVSLQNNNCNFIEAENTARKKELERILQVDFIGVLQKKSNIMIAEKRAIYKHLQNNCYEESILQLNKNISECVKDLKENDAKQRNLKQQLSQLETIINNKVADLIPNIENEMDLFKKKIGDNPNDKLLQYEEQLKIINEKLVHILLDVIKNRNDNDIDIDIDIDIDNDKKEEFEIVHKMEFNELEKYKQDCEGKHKKFLKQRDSTINKYNINIEHLISNINHLVVYNNQESTLYNKNLYTTTEGEINVKKRQLTLIIKYEKEIRKIIDIIDKYNELINNKKEFINKCNEETLPTDIITLLEEVPIFEFKEELKGENTKLEHFIKGKNKSKKYTISDLEKYKELHKNTSIYEYLENYQSEQEDKCFKKEEYIETIKELETKIREENIKINKITQNLSTELSTGDNIIFNKEKANANANTILIKLSKIKLSIENYIEERCKWIKDYENDISIKNNNKQIEKRIQKLKDKRKLLNETCNADYELFVRYYNISQKVKQCESEIEVINNEIEKINTNKNDYKTIETKYKENELNKEDINEMRKQLEFIKGEDKKIEFKLNVGKTEFTRNNTKLDEHKKEIERMKDIEKELNIYTVYNEALKNLPFVIIKKVVPRLESKINELLSVCTNFVVKVQVDNNHIEIYIDRPIYNGRLILLNNASGFERFISSLAIRLALLDISQLPKPNFIAIDEGWTSFDYNNLNNVRTIFDFLVEKFDFVLSISHLSQIKEHCSSQIHLKKNDKGYSIIV